ncbi:hypothetical protein IQ218_07390 [Synechocystis salina LEGE 06099]|uniref:hypothetical protein n=1 Tax=Synechocystis salina TaxID=945780 RepID=UPI001880F89B|nr:hypothetical protein [Synechocystis salina]MBE9203304.1 hypothetical protein [Synechocystis salina LEGE 06099]
MIRTKLVELSTIEAVAYRQKLRDPSKSGVVILRYDTDQPGLATINKASGEPDLAANVPADLFPVDAFREALELTSGLPYSKRGKVRLTATTTTSVPTNMPDAAEDDAPEDLETVCSQEYEAIVAAYTNKKGELSYDLLNKDFIQFANSSKIVSNMVAEKASEEDIRNHIVKVKLEALTNNRELSMGQTKLIVEMLDAVSPKGVFRELNAEIRRMLARR